MAVAALTGELDIRSVKASAIRGLIEDRVDPELFRLSYDYVGDLPETVALIWPAAASGSDVGPIGLAETVDALERAGRSNAPAILAGFLDQLDETGRWALLKLVTGGMRVGVSARLVKQALAQFGAQDIAEIEELWHGFSPPYERLLAWLDGRSDRPVPDDEAIFRPLMLANPLEEAELSRLDPHDFRAEWKWDGIRVQIAAENGRRRLYSRSGDEIGQAFPEIIDAMDFDAVLDGELLVMRPPPGPGQGGVPASFGDLQKRLGRKTVSRKLQESHPAAVRLYDLLRQDREDLRSLTFDERRRRLERWYDSIGPDRMDLSELIPLTSWQDMDRLRQEARRRGMEGLMLKRGDSAYLAGRPKGPWFKWKRDPLTADCVLMYAQRGHGKRSSFYSDFTFGVWREGSAGHQLVPVGKAYFGFTDAELAELDRFVRQNTTSRFGPVREVTPTLVLEVAFDSIHASTRHKSGLAMRFPRVHRIRWDKPAAEADRLETLATLME